MLELEIQKLCAAIEKLTHVMSAAKADAPAEAPAEIPAKATVPPPTPAPAPAAVQKKPPAPAPAPAAAASPPVTRQDLTTLCTSIVRADRSRRDDVIGILRKHGAETITRLPDGALAAVRDALEAIAHEIAAESTSEDGK